MGLYNWFRTQATGVDLDAEQKRSDAADAALVKLNTDAEYLARLTPEDQMVVAEHLVQQVADSKALSGQVDSAFVTGLKEGFDAEVQLVHDSADAVGSTVWKAIPLWVWGAGAVGLFLYMGGGPFLKGILPRGK